MFALWFIIYYLKDCNQIIILTNKYEFFNKNNTPIRIKKILDKKKILGCANRFEMKRQS